MKEEQLKIRLNETTKRDFKKALSGNGNFITGVILIFIDAYIKNPQQTITALKRIRG